MKQNSIAIAFAKKFFTCLTHTPDQLGHFYEPGAVMSRCTDESCDEFRSVEKIAEAYRLGCFANVHTLVQRVDWLPLPQEGLVILVTGFQSQSAAEPARPFAETFVLAPHEMVDARQVRRKSYFVAADIFRTVETDVDRILKEQHSETIAAVVAAAGAGPNVAVPVSPIPAERVSAASSSAPPPALDSSVTDAPQLAAAAHVQPEEAASEEATTSSSGEEHEEVPAAPLPGDGSAVEPVAASAVVPSADIPALAAPPSSEPVGEQPPPVSLALVAATESAPASDVEAVPAGPTFEGIPPLDVGARDALEVGAAPVATQEALRDPASEPAAAAAAEVCVSSDGQSLPSPKALFPPVGPSAQGAVLATASTTAPPTAAPKSYLLVAASAAAPGPAASGGALTTSTAAHPASVRRGFRTVPAAAAATEVASANSPAPSAGGCAGASGPVPDRGRTGPHPAQNSLYVRGWTGEGNEGRLREVFGQFGTVRRVSFASQNRIYCFVDFDAPEGAQRALKGKVVLDGAELHVEPRQSMRPRGPVASGSAPVPGGRAGRGGGFRGRGSVPGRGGRGGRSFEGARSMRPVAAPHDVPSPAPSAIPGPVVVA